MSRMDLIRTIAMAGEDQTPLESIFFIDWTPKKRYVRTEVMLRANLHIFSEVSCQICGKVFRVYSIKYGADSNCGIFLFCSEDCRTMVCYMCPEELTEEAKQRYYLLAHRVRPAGGRR